METSPLIVDVKKMAPEGEAIAFPMASNAGQAQQSSRVIFIAGAVPGDRLEVELVSAKSSFARARIKRLLTPGPDRIQPPCPLHDAPGRPTPACGGCNWQQLAYETQLKHKREMIRDCLGRIAKMREAAVEPVLASPQAWGYRNKVQIPFGLDKTGKIIAGFYASSSHQIVDFNACPVQPELSVRIALKVKELAVKLRWPIYDAQSNRGWLRHLFVRTNSQGKALAALVTHSPMFLRHEEFISEMREAFPEIVSFYQNVQPLKTSVILGESWRRLWGACGLEEKIGRFTFFASPGVFLQVNTEAAALLYDAALAALKDGGPAGSHAPAAAFDLILDLYCGVGTLACWLAQAATRMIGVEENPQAVRDAWANAERNKIKNARFYAGKVESLLPKLKKELPARCAAVVDPPRSGLSEPVLRLLTERSISRVVYVSCNPATFARDVGYLSKSGFKLGRVQPVDLFPQTSHIELVAQLNT
ncbi:MAG: 23S rRNA (uracil-5-)-methyltransferase RumA [Elusimicrobia bacterium RIFCSPHIGHO2_02_FULL_57_9]|nr:MAG: 23S rRNA (uracil-5-)-methyltransferase RumA [Elusimicrobia bacterium RIFCSPHIGHO2_02_FULL_57_9]